LYAIVWNRVFLLAAGIAFGWTLVNYWVVSPKDKLRQRNWLLLSVLGGGAVLVLLGRVSPSAAKVGSGVFFFSALVAYAANAKQVGKEGVFLPPALPERDPSASSWKAVLFIVGAEPPSYSGPEEWRRILARLEQEGPLPHWFVRPRLYARLRAAYEATGERAPFWSALEDAIAPLQRELGEETWVRAFSFWEGPQLAKEFAQLVREGAVALYFLPMGLGEDGVRALREWVTASRVREVGVRVEYYPQGDVLLAEDEALARLCHLVEKGTFAPLEEAFQEFVVSWAEPIAKWVAEERVNVLARE